MQEQYADDAEPTLRTRRRGRRILVALLLMAFLAVASMGGFLLYLNSKVGSIQTDTTLLPTAGSNDGGGTGEGTGSGGETLVTDAGTNYLIIGSDARPGETFSRSDVIILAHVTKKKDKVYLIHFPRDLYVQIPGRTKDKINAAYAYGGGALLAQTLQNLTKVKVDHAAKIDFEGFKRMTDAVGGVRVWAEQPSTQGDLQIVKGWNDLNGTQALVFVRERYQLREGDIDRGRRQMAFVKALMVKTISPGVLLNPVKLTTFIQAATDNMTVDAGLTGKYIRSEALSMRDLRPDDIVFITAPFSGYGTAPNGGAIDILDEIRMDRLAEALQNDKVDQYLAEN